MYFDSHAHLDDKCFQPDFDAILARMRENGVTGMMNIGCDLPSSERSVALAERYDWIWAAVGSHPDDADHVDEARIERTDFCKVTLTYYDGRRIENLEPRRLFPLSGLHKYITLLDDDGREAAIIRSLDTLIPESRRAVEECLEEFYLIPRITGIYDITDKKGSLSWHVQTDRGERRFSIRNRHSDIKVLYDGRVLVRDSDDNRYEIPSLYELDKKSRAKLKSEI